MPAHCPDARGHNPKPVSSVRAGARRADQTLTPLVILGKAAQPVSWWLHAPRDGFTTTAAASVAPIATHSPVLRRGDRDRR